MTQLSTGINDDKTQLLKKDQLNIDKSDIPMFSTMYNQSTAKRQRRNKVEKKFLSPKSFSQVEQFEVIAVWAS